MTFLTSEKTCLNWESSSSSSVSNSLASFVSDSSSSVFSNKVLGYLYYITHKKILQDNFLLFYWAFMKKDAILIILKFHWFIILYWEFFHRRSWEEMFWSAVIKILIHFFELLSNFALIYLIFSENWQNWSSIFSNF